MAKSKIDKKNVALIVAILAVITLAAYFGGVFSIAEKVGLASESGYATPDQALAACERDRATANAGGQTCDPCGLACPSSALDGTYEYSNINGVFKVTFDPAKCSSQYQAVGNLLEAKSFCHDTIRLCEKQSGTGTITKVTQVKNGVVNTITYSYYLTDCSTGKTVGTSTLTSEINQLQCNSGYMVDGTRSSQYISNLGSCVVIPAEGTTPTTPTKAATLRDVVISSTAQSGKSLRITGVADITGADGNYYVHGTLSQPSNTFSVVSGFGFRDECGSDPLAATLIKTVKKGDQLVFSLDIVAPIVQGSSSIESGYTVTVFDRCGGTALATKTGTYELVPKPVPTTTPIIVPVTNETVPDFGAIANEQQAQQGTTCVAGDQVELQGCIVAKCNAGVMDAIDPIICGNNTYSSPATTDSNGNVVPTTETASTSWFVRFIEWLKSFFGGGN